MSGWRYHDPVRIHFGSGTLDDIGSVLAGRTYALVTYPNPPFPSLVKRIAASAGDALLVIDGVRPNPAITKLRQQGEQLLALPRVPDVLVALGGGSVIDTAKVLAAGKGHLDPVLGYMADGRSLEDRSLPVIAIPTTAGTGSEVTCWATVWDPEQGRKLSLARDDLYPEVALADPALTAGLPMPITISSGLDALSHALESIWNRNANPVTRDMAVRAAREIMTALSRLSAAPGDMTARQLMMQGALRAGLAFSNTKTALAHNISYPITLRRNVPHGIACSFCLPDVMEAALGVDPDCDAALAEIFGDLRLAPAKLHAFLTGLGVAGEPASYGMDARQWRAVVEEAFDGPRGRNFIGLPSRFPFRGTAIADPATPGGTP
jgi:alcohol dehydrogenase